MKSTTTKAATAQAKLDAVLNLIAAPAVEVQQVPAKPTAAQRKSAASAKRIKADVAQQIAAQPQVDHKPSNLTISKLIAEQDKSNAAAITTFINSKDEDGAPAPTGYQGPMKALRDRVKAGKYTKAANGQPSCGDEVAQTLGALEPTEVIKACMIAMDIANPYLNLNIGQQSMNLRNKLRGQLKRGEIGMGVLREAVEVVIEGRPVKTATPAPAPAPEVKEEAPKAPAKPAKTRAAKAKK